MLVDEIGKFFDMAIDMHKAEVSKTTPVNQYQKCRKLCLDTFVHYTKVDRMSGDIHLRRKLVDKFSWAIPSRSAIDHIKENAPNGVIEIGCGGGYWASLLRDSDVGVFGYDKEPKEDAWIHDIREGDESNAGDHPEMSLMLCWPTYDHGWAAAAVEKYLSAGGKTVIYIGEGYGGCTGDDRLHDLLCDMTEVILEDTSDGGCHIPQWDGIHDSLHIYKA